MQGQQIKRNREALEARVAELEQERDDLSAQLDRALSGAVEVLTASAPAKGLTLSDYQALAARTAPVDLSPDDRRLNCAMGLVGEFGELVDLLKKARFHGHSDGLKDKLRDEFGDVLWYLAEAATIGGHGLGIAMGDADRYSLIEMAHEMAALATAIERDGKLPPCQGVLIVVVLIEREGLELEDVLARNVAKLEARYPNGFDKQRSQSRHLDDVDDLIPPVVVDGSQWATYAIIGEASYRLKRQRVAPCEVDCAPHWRSGHPSLPHDPRQMCQKCGRLWEPNQ
jgi:NTP pyrophosphatase (non-canonical NTP hydrolase)